MENYVCVEAHSHIGIDRRLRRGKHFLNMYRQGLCAEVPTLECLIVVVWKVPVTTWWLIVQEQEALNRCGFFGLKHAVMCGHSDNAKESSIQFSRTTCDFSFTVESWTGSVFRLRTHSGEQSGEKGLIFHDFKPGTFRRHYLYLTQTLPKQQT